MIRDAIKKISITAMCALAISAANADSGDDVSFPMMPMMDMNMMSMDHVVYESVGFIEGMDFSTSPFHIHMDTTGNDSFYRATLTDFEFPEAFTYLGLMVTSATESLGGVQLMGGGQGYFDFEATPGMYYANVFGVAGDTFDTSLYGVQIAMVPEMEVWAMMLAGMGLLGYKLRRRQNNDGNALAV